MIQIQVADRYPDRHQNRVIFGLRPTTPKISSKFVHNFLNNLADRQTDRQTDTSKHNLLPGN